MKCLYLPITALIFFAVSQAFSQDNKELPKTKLQAFDDAFGTVTIKGFSKIGSLRGNFGGQVAVQSKEFINTATGKKEYGITIDVTEAGSSGREHRSYIDYDEISSLIKGLNYISKIDKSATKFEDFEADYRTKDDLEFTVFSSDNGVRLAVQSGRIGAATAYFKLEDIVKLQQFIVAAKQTIDAVKQQ